MKKYVLCIWSVKRSDYCKNQRPTARREKQIQGLLENASISNNKLISSVYRELDINCLGHISFFIRNNSTWLVNNFYDIARGSHGFFTLKLT